MPERLAPEDWCLPGQPLVRGGRAGAGTHEYQGAVQASVAGRWQLADDGTVTVTARRHAQSEKSGAAASLLPQVGSVVLCRILRIRPKEASVEIIAVHDQACREPFPGVVRAQDVRSVDRDRVRMHECFRPGDIVRAQVV